MSGVWAALRDRCRLQRTSPNAPDHESVVGRMVLAVLSGGNRYRHVDGVRSDVVAGGASGSVNFGLGSPMVTVYGKQSGSAVGYNSTKPGRPSYRYHMSLIGGLLLPLNGDVRPGNESLGVYTA